MALPTQIAKPDHEGYKKLITAIGGDKEMWNKFHWNLLGKSEDDEALVRMIIRTNECLEKTGRAIIKLDPELIGADNARILLGLENSLTTDLMVYNKDTKEIALTRKAVEIIYNHLKAKWPDKATDISLRDAFIESNQVFMMGKPAGS